MKDILDRLEKRREDARGAAERAYRGTAPARQVDRARAHRAPSRQRLLRRVRHVRRAPLEPIRHGEKKIPGDGVVTGWATVNGRAVYLFSKDFTVFGGSLPETHGQKIIKVQDMAMRARGPIGGLLEAGGARIQEGVAALGGYGDVFKRTSSPPRRRDPADQRHHGAMRRRRRLFAGHDRFHLHGARHQLHVRHRPRRGEDRHQRGGHRRGTGRRLVRAHEIRRRRCGSSRTMWVPEGDAPPDRFPAGQ